VNGRLVARPARTAMMPTWRRWLPAWPRRVRPVLGDPCIVGKGPKGPRRLSRWTKFRMVDSYPSMMDTGEGRVAAALEWAPLRSGQSTVRVTASLIVYLTKRPDTILTINPKITATPIVVRQNRNLSLCFRPSPIAKTAMGNNQLFSLARRNSRLTSLQGILPTPTIRACQTFERHSLL
jgi:hypothetical protein